MKVKGRVPPTQAQRELAVAMYKQEPALSLDAIARGLALKTSQLVQIIADARKADPTLPYRSAEDIDRLAKAARADPANRPRRYWKPRRLGVLNHDDF